MRGSLKTSKAGKQGSSFHHRSPKLSQPMTETMTDTENFQASLFDDDTQFIGLAPASCSGFGDRVWTPEWCVRDMIEHFQPKGEILEPFKGAGAFTDLLPDAHWCEVDEGRDFFSWVKPVDWIISNPPYSRTVDCFRHGHNIAENVVFLVPIWKAFTANGLLVDLY